VFISWTDTERRRIALDVAAGRLDYRIARALLDGYIYLGQHDWKKRREVLDSAICKTYSGVCRLLSIPCIEVFHWYEYSASTQSRYRAEVYCDLAPAGWELSESGIAHLEDVAKKLHASEETIEGISPLGHFFVRFNETVDPETGFTSEELAEDFVEELLHVLTSTVFRKAG